jgi:hypothetical protein
LSKGIHKQHQVSDSQPKSNPQGKGEVALLKALSEHETGFVPRPKDLTQVSRELFSSLFVLHSDCKFQAVPNQTYWLYRLEGRFKLMLLGPQDWAVGSPGEFWAKCHLEADMTWSVTFSELALADEDFQKETLLAQQRFECKLEACEQLKHALPSYVENLSYHQRVLAYGLSRSLRVSMELTGISELSHAEATLQLKK